MLSISDYKSETTETIVRTCIHLASVLGDVKDDIVLIGGMVPFFLVDQSAMEYEHKHCGSMDADIVLSIALLEEDRYDTIVDRLRGSGFEQDDSEKGNPSHQRWRHKKFPNAVVEFLIDVEGRAGSTKHLTSELAAFIAPGAEMAFIDVKQITLKGTTLDGAITSERTKVCGPGAFVLLKALALRTRDKKGKDAYDIDYVVRHVGSGLNEIAEAIRGLLDHEKAREGLRCLEECFETIDSLGPKHLEIFIGQGSNDDLRADASGLVMQLVALCK
jgi:hypothetical protein